MSSKNLTMKPEYSFTAPPMRPLSDSSRRYMHHRRALIRGCEKAWKIEEDIMGKRTTLTDHYTVDGPIQAPDKE